MILHYIAPGQKVEELDLLDPGQKYQVIDFDANSYSSDLELAETQGIEVLIVKDKQ